MSRRRTTLRTAGVAGASACLIGLTMAPGFAVEGADDVQVINTETVQTYMSAKGQVESKRLYEQVSLTGNGKVDLRNPVATDGLRNLNQFGGFDVSGSDQVIDTTVSGYSQYRSVSDYKGDLPLEITPEYVLDGKPMSPSDIVGKSGELQVTFTVRNVTAQEQDVTFSDGHGGTVTKSVEVPIPIVGSVTTLAPPNFTDVASDSANMAGDGHGNTKLSFTMTLFPPIGSDTTSFGYTAQVEDAVVPQVDITALPVNPLESPSFKSAGESYQGGAKTGEKLVAGAGLIDENLLKLRDGASSLLSGLIQLSDGADQLSAGLNGEAAPGARQLADGAGELQGGLWKLDDGAQRLSAGLGQLDDGANQLADGANQLADGTGEAKAGSTRLADGASRLSDGLTQADSGAGDLLAGAKQLRKGLKALKVGVDDLPTKVKKQLETNAEYLQLLGALSAIQAGIGPSWDAAPESDPPTLLGGINKLQYGLRAPGTTDCLVALAGGDPTNCGAMDAVQLVSSALASGATNLDQLRPALQYLNATNNVGDTPCPGYPAYDPPPAPPTTACQMVAAIYYGLFEEKSETDPGGAQAQVNTAAAALQTTYEGVDDLMLAEGVGLDLLRAGLDNPDADPTACAAAQDTATTDDDCGIKQVAMAVQGGIPVLVDGILASIQQSLLGAPKGDPQGVIQLAAGGDALVDGVNQLADGIGQLAAGGDLLSSGAEDLSSGLTRIESGSSRLADGAGQLADGTTQAADGSNQLADGTTQAADGSGRLADGADQLADGLQTAADGSLRLAGGLTKAEDGAPQLVDGAQRLSDEGMSQLTKAGEDTAQQYGELYATLQAGAERAQTEKMVVGAPEGAMGLTAYSFVLKGDDGEDTRNAVRMALGLGGLLAGGGALLLRRRLFV